jgi:hypothetical protein
MTQKQIDEIQVAAQGILNDSAVGQALDNAMPIHAKDFRRRAMIILQIVDEAEKSSTARGDSQ